MIIGGNRDFSTKYDIDLKKHPDSEIVRVFGKECRVGDIRRSAEAMSEKNKNMIVFYDDVAQYTSLGLIDLLFEMHNIPSNVPIEEFMDRKTSGIEFVINVCKLWNISEEEVRSVFKNNYSEVLRRSPFTKNFLGFLLMRKFLDSQMFVFKYPFNGIKTIMEPFKKEYQTNASNGYVSLEVDTINDLTIREYLDKMSKSRLRYLEIVMTEDAGSVMSFIDNNNIDIGTNIFTFEKHNNLSEDQLVSIYANEGFGNGDYRVNFIKEGFARC